MLISSFFKLINFCFVVSVYYSSAMEEKWKDYIKYEVFGGGSPGHSKPFSNLFIAAIVDSTHIHQVVH